MLGNASLVASTFPAPNVAVPRQLPHWKSNPAGSRCGACKQHGSDGQHHSPILLACRVPPQPHRANSGPPRAQQQSTQKMRAPERINDQWGVVAVQGSKRFDVRRSRKVKRRQTRLNTSVPLVPPKPKLFFTTMSRRASRAVLAQ